MYSNYHSSELGFFLNSFSQVNHKLRVMMKPIPGCCFIFLLLSVLIPEETEAAGLDPSIIKQLKTLAAKNAKTWLKNTIYAKCKTNGVPPGIKCPKDVFGVGPNEKLAVDMAIIYAGTVFRNKQCQQFVDKNSCKYGKFSPI